ncbi:MAG: YciI family protein [Myxococcota bacterium]
MQYLLLIYADESLAEHVDEAARRAQMAVWQKVTEDMKAAGVWRAGQALRSTASATSVRTREGKTLHTDGPFAETKEQLGGFYLIEVDNADEALVWAKRLPTAEYGCIEVRPILQVPGL